MSRKQKLKVYRTPIGFHDAYVAAPSQKAALEAWGSDRDLFGRGVAEQVHDDTLMQEPLAHPGKVIKLSRGTAAEQLAALPDTVSAVAGKSTARPVRKSKSIAPDKATKRPPKPTPKPDRGPLERAQQVLDETSASFEAERQDLKLRADQLARDRTALEKRETTKLAKLGRALETAEADYQRRMRAWRG